MKILAVLLCLVPLVAHAATPEENFIAAHEKFVAQFKLKDGEQITDAITKAEEQARHCKVN